MPQPNVNQASSTAGKRRSRRFPFISPVEATWQEPNGKILREAGQAMEVNTQGGLLEMKTYPAVGTQIEITNLLSHESSHARVVGLRRCGAGQDWKSTRLNSSHVASSYAVFCLKKKTSYL